MAGRGRPRKLRGGPKANALAEFLGDLGDRADLKTQGFAERFGGGKTTWAQYLNGSSVIPKRLLGQVVEELCRTDPRRREQLLVRANQLYKAAEAEARAVRVQQAAANAQAASKSPASTPPPPSPFRGLQPFRTEDAKVFCGRDKDTEDVVTALSGESMPVTLVGPSGCGKSSLALAGVAPAMKGYETVVVHCGRTSNPVRSLAIALLELVREERFGPPRTTDVEEVVDWLTGSGMLADTVHRLTGRPTIELLVVVDQAEALLDLPKEDLTALLSVLFSERHTAGIRLLFTLRADFVDASLSHEQLGPVLQHGALRFLTPMTRDQLREAIYGPLGTVKGVQYEEGLARRILDDAGSEAGVLPLLGFVLQQLWEQQVNGELTVEAYESARGVSGALGRHAERAWETHVLNGNSPSNLAGNSEPPELAETVAQARRLLAGLVRVVSGSGAPVVRRVLTRAEAGERLWRLAVRFAGQQERLLVLHGEEGVPESVELAHETLITAWPQLAEVVRVDRDFLAVRSELQHDRERWESSGRPDALLPRGEYLSVYETRLAGRSSELAAAERDFLRRADELRREERQRIEDEQRQQDLRRRRARQAWAAGGLACALIAVLGVFFVQEKRVSEQRAAEGRSRTLAVQSDQLAENNPAQAALAAVAGYDTSPTQEARNALMRRYSELMKTRWVMSGLDSDISQSSMSADGQVTLVITEGGRATLFVRSDDGRVRQQNLRLGQKIRNPEVSADGRRIAYMRDDDALVAWHEVLPSGKHLAGPAHVLRHTQARNKEGDLLAAKWVRFSSDSRYLVEASQVQGGLPVLVWDLARDRPHEVPKSPSEVRGVWFGPDNETVIVAKGLKAFGEGHSALMTIDAGTGTSRELAHDFDSNAEVSWDGNTAVVCHKAGGTSRYRAVGVTDGKVLRSQEIKQASCWKPEFDTTSRYFVIPAPSKNDNSQDKLRIAIHSDEAPQRLVPRQPVDDSMSARRLPLLMTESTTVMPVAAERSVTGVTMSAGTSVSPYGYPVLLDDGDRMLSRTDGGKVLRLMETITGARTLARAATPGTPPTEEQPLITDKAETRVADLSDGNRVTIRDLPSLRRISQFAVSPPPSAEGTDEQDSVDIMFRGDHRVVTLSGSVLEYWDARNGHRLSAAVDLSKLGLSTAEDPEFTMGAHPDPAHVTVSVLGEPELHTINLRTGQEARKQRLHLADDLLTAEYLPDTRYMAVLTTGRIVELWSVKKGAPPRRVLGPFGPLEPHEWTMGSTGGSGFFLGYENTLVRLRADDPEYRDTLTFSQQQLFQDATKDGKTLLSMPVSGDFYDEPGPLTLFRVDPALWKKHLCTAVGRDLTPDERTALSGELPEKNCPGRTTE